MSRMLRLSELPASKAIANTKPKKVSSSKAQKVMSLSEYHMFIEKASTPYESTMQMKVIEWAEGEVYKGNPLALYIHHSPNGGKRSAVEAARFKAMGTQSGYPDLTIDIARGGYHGMRLELKRTDNDYESPNQTTRIQLLKEEGYHAVITKGYMESIKAIAAYMKL